MRGPIVLTSSAGSFPGLVAMLRELPVAVEERPLLRFAPPEDWMALDVAIHRAERYQAVAFTSPRAARALAGRLTERGLRWDVLAPHRPEIWTAGAGTARALEDTLGSSRGPSEADVGQLGAAHALARAMIAAGVAGPVLFPCGDLRRDELPVCLREAGIEVDEVVCYRSVLADEREAREAVEGAGAIIVSSPSVATLLGRACPPDVRPPLLAVGPTTAAAAQRAGWPPAGVASQPMAESLASAVRALLSQ